MGKEASVAPKERVNIIYRPATGGAQEEVELPLKMLIMGDFTLGADDRPVEKREAVSIDKDNFNEVLKAQNINLDMTVPNKLTGDTNDELKVSLRIESMKDFEPDAIVKNAPELNRLLQLREGLTSLTGPLSNQPEFRKKVESLVKDEAAREQLLKELGIKE